MPDFLWRRQRESDRGRTRLDGSRGVIIPALDLDPESDFQLFEDSGTGFRSSKNWNRVMILALDPEPE